MLVSADKRQTEMVRCSGEGDTFGENGEEVDGGGWDQMDIRPGGDRLCPLRLLLCRSDSAERILYRIEDQVRG